MRVERDTVSLGAFEFECGESIPELECAYEAYGEFTGSSEARTASSDRTESASNAVLVCHALTGSQHVTEPRGAHGEGGTTAATSGQARAWWSDVVGPGKAVDTNEYYVVCVNVPGSCYGTTGPASEGPDGEPYGPDFPPVTVGDWTRAQRAVLDALGVGRLHAVVGGSVGGMNVLEWAKRYPDDVRRAIPIAAAPRLDAQSLALDAIARRAITTDPNWQGGRYYGDGTGSTDRDGIDDGEEDDGDFEGDDGDGGSGGDGEGDGDSEGTHPDDGLAMARQIGHVMYLSKDSMERKFGRRAAGRDAAADTFPADPAAGFFPYREVESYLDYQAGRFVDRFDANSYLYLTRAMDDYDLAAGYESDADALAAFRGEAMVVSFTADWHFTVEQSEALAEAFRSAGVDVAHHVVDSDHGHDAFLVEPENVGPPLADFLADGVDGRAVTDTRDEGTSGDDHAPVHSSLIGD